MLRRDSKFRTYPDGWGTSWVTEDRRLVSVRQEVVHFRVQTVGATRFWQAMTEGTKISKAVLVPDASAVDQGDIFVIEGVQYEVVQKQYKDDTLPASWLLSLAETPFEYPEAGEIDG